MEWLLGLFLITSPLFFWAWAVIFFFIIMAFEENELNFFAFVSLGIFIALAVHSPVIHLTFEPMTWLMWGILYYIVGGIWSFIKWFSFITKRAESFGELKLQFIRILNKDGLEYTRRLSENGEAADELNADKLAVDIKTELPKQCIRDFKKFLASSDHNFDYINTDNYSDKSTNLDDIIPLASAHKEKIVTWILWWPTSAFWTILNDPLIRLANWMYKKFQGFYTRIAKRIFAKFGI